MTKPLEEGLEFREHDIPNMIAEAVERFDDGGPPCWPFLSKRYVEGYLELHVHWRHGSDFPFSDQCAVLKCAERDTPVSGETDERALPEDEIGHASNSACDEMLPVFVFAAKIVDQPERMLRRVRSAVRLQLVNSGLGGCRGFPDLPYRARLAFIEGAIHENRKFNVSRVLRRPIPLDQTGGQIIEGLSEAIEGCPNERAKTRGCVVSQRRAHGVLSALRIVLTDQLIWVGFEVLPDSDLHEVELFVCEV